MNADTVVIGFGGNVPDPDGVRATFERAREALHPIGSLASAPLYRTRAIGPDQPDFLNTAVRITWRHATAAEILQTVQEIERLLGRDRARETRWGPRTLDLDVLLWGDHAMRTEDLEVPHPRLLERRFALEPVVALVGESVIIRGAPLGTWLARVRDQHCELVSDAW